MRDEKPSVIGKTFFLGIILTIIGFAVFFGFREGGGLPEGNVVDITPGSGFDWNRLEEDMHVKITVQNAFGYYFQDREKPRDISSQYRNYVILDYSKDTKNFDYVIGVHVRQPEFPDWDKLSRDTNLAKGVSGGMIEVEGIIKKNERENTDKLKEFMSRMGIQPDKAEKMVLPYTIVPIEKDKHGVLRYAMLIVGLVGIALVIINVVNLVLEKKAMQYANRTYVVEERPLQESPYAAYEREMKKAAEEAKNPGNADNPDNFENKDS